MTQSNNMYESQKQSLQQAYNLSNFLADMSSGSYDFINPGYDDTQTPLDNTIDGLKSEGGLSQKLWNGYKGAWKDASAPYLGMVGQNTMKGLQTKGNIGQKLLNGYKGAWKDAAAPYMGAANVMKHSPALKAAQKLKQIHDGPGIRNALKSIPGNMQNKVKNLAGSAGNKINQISDAIKDKGLSGASKDALKEGGKKAGEGLKNFGNFQKNAWKGAGRVAGAALMGTPAGDAVAATVGAAKNAAEVGKTAKAAAEALAASNPATAAVLIAKEAIKDLLTDPKKFMKKTLMVCGCVCSSAMAPIFTIVFAAGLLIAMFASLFSNDSAKSNAPKAQDSWIYKYASDKGYMDTIKAKVSIDPEQTFVISHNAKLQQDKINSDKKKDPSELVIGEDSDEMKESEGYTDAPIYLYHEPNSSATKVVSQLRYGQTIVAAMSDKNEPVYAGEDGEYLAIEVSDPEQIKKYDVEGKTGLENPDRASEAKVTRYIKSSLVYRKEAHDPGLEYTIKDEYELMSVALKETLRDKLDSSVKEGNKKIDEEAKNYEKDISDAELSDTENYQKLGAALLYDGDRIVEEVSSIKNPGFDTFDVGGSRSMLNASAPALQGLNQDVATILSGYAVSKADSLPEAGYYKMLDNTMIKYLKNALTLKPGQLTGTPMTRVLSSKRVEEHSMLEFSKSPSIDMIGISVPYDSETMSDIGNVFRYTVVNEGNVKISPKSTNKDNQPEPITGDIYLYEDIKVNSSSYYKESPYGEMAILSPVQYMLAYGESDINYVISKVRSYHKKFAEYKTVRTTSKAIDSVDFDYKEYRYVQSITPLNAEEVVWQFFEQTGDYYPMVNNGKNTDNAYGESINIKNASSWQEKYKLTRSLPYYQQQLSYLFDNSNLEDNEEYFKFDNPLFLANYPGEEEYIYAKIVGGSPSKDSEKISGAEVEKLTSSGGYSDFDIGSDGYVVNYKKVLVENYSSTKTTNMSGNKAKERKFLWIIPLGYEQEYRRASEPEEINLNKLDPNMNYITNYKKSRNIAGSMLPPGSLAVPIENWQDHVSSDWDPNRYVNGVYLPHFAVDIARPKGTPIYSVSDGIVIKTTIGVDMGGVIVPGTPGTGIWVKNEETDMVFMYYHGNERSESELMVHVGDRVVAGQQIGVVGSTGISSGPHLHFQVFKSSSNLSDNADSSYNAREFLENLTTVVQGGSSINTSTTDSTDENNEERAADEYSRETVIMSVGNKMDYWFDNIMTMLSEQDGNMSGTGGRAVAELAMSYLGDVGGKYFRTEYWGPSAYPSNGLVRVYHSGNGGAPTDYHWCAVFVSIILRDAGVGDIAPSDESVRGFVDWANSNGYIHDDDGNYIPKPGDLVIYEWGSFTGSFDHIGFIYSADSSGYRTIEGNTGGEGAGDPNDMGSWKGAVNSHTRSYNDATNNVKFISVPYPDQDDPSVVIAEYAQKAFGTTPTTIDVYGRVGIGAWSGKNLSSLLQEIEKQHKKEVEALIAEGNRGTELRDIIDGKATITPGTSAVVKKMLALPKSKTIQVQKLQNRINDIDKTAGSKALFGEKWSSIDSRAKVYVTMMQLLMDSYGEPGWLAQPKIKQAILDAIDKEGSVDTFVSALNPFIKDLGKKQNKDYLSYNNYAHLLEYAGKKESDWRNLFSAAKGKVAQVEATTKGIPEERLTFGLGNGKEFILPKGLGSTKSFMGNHMLGDSGTKQAEMKHISETGPNGLAMIDGRIVIAMYVGPPGAPKGYGSVGDKVDILLSTGQILNCVIGDAKAIESDSKNYNIHHGYSYDMALKWGIHNDGSIVEFVLNTRHAGRYPSTWPNFTSIYPGYVTKVVNLGPYR